MKPLYVCTMVFSQHELLRKLFLSIAASTRRPDGVYVVDHAYDATKIDNVRDALGSIPLEIVTIDDPSCAVAANWLMTHVPDDRVGCGDDVQFEPDALEIMAATPGDFVIPEPTLNPAACCLIRDSCIEKIGLFDEKISPQYLYFEDSDYIRRLELAGLTQTVAAGARAIHEGGGSQTYKAYTPAQIEEHHRRFFIAQANYIKKWGGLPFHETLTTPVAL